MATWSIEHIPANGGASTFASLGVWGFASLQMQFVNWGIDQAAVTTRGGSIAFEAAQFAYLDKLVVWRNGARFAHFWITGLGTSYQVQESRTYTLSGPAWWLAQYALEDTSNITLYTAGAYIALGMASAIAAGAPVACHASLSAALDIGCPDVRSAGTVLALVQEAARHVPFSSGWWDCSGEIPVLTASRRSAGDSTTLTIGTDPIESFGLTPLPDQQVKSVCIQFGWTGSSSYYLECAGTDYTKSGPNRVQVTLNYATPAAALQAAGCGVASKYYVDMAAIPWGGSINLHAAEPADITPIRPGRKVNLAGGLAEWATMDALVQSVVWSVSPETNDLCTLNLGAPDQLGIQEYFDLRAAVGSSAAGESAAEPVSSSDPTPGTYDDLNGGTGGGTPGGSIVAQARGGAWALCGHAEITRDGTYRVGSDGYLWHGAPIVASTPPRRYRRWAGTGSITSTYYSVDCSVVVDVGSVCTASGAQVYTPGAACALSQNDAAGMYLGVDRREDYTRTTMSITPETGGCMAVNAGYSARITGSQLWALTGEDTDGDAIGRMLATEPEWASGATAIRTVRTDGVTGIYREARYRTEHSEDVGQQIWIEGQWVDGVWIAGHYKTAQAKATYATLVGLSPWQRYRVTVALESRPVDSAGAPTGSGEWSADGMRQHYILANIDGEGGFDWQTIEPTAGYETRIASSTVEVT